MSKPPTRGFSPTGYIMFGAAALAIVLFVVLLVTQRGCSQDVESGSDDLARVYVDGGAAFAARA
ncbi:hypothetical protein [Rubricoccus marinus]|uniref:hypothetical protein n=1 Tax=Rubricoccus marinus TaxID=716817 RepID=UPI00117A5947|nr:hypothetical protein [Rubricoccus marinus]